MTHTMIQAIVCGNINILRWRLSRTTVSPERYGTFIQTGLRLANQFNTDPVILEDYVVTVYRRSEMSGGLQVVWGLEGMEGGDTLRDIIID